MLLDLVDDFISNQLEHGLHHVCTTVAHIRYRLKTGCYQVLVDNLQKINRVVVSECESDKKQSEIYSLIRCSENSTITNSSYLLLMVLFSYFHNFRLV